MAGSGHIDGLTVRQRKFVEAYAGDAQAAAVAAGYSESSAQVEGCGLLKHPAVAAAILARESKSTRPLIRSRVKRQEWLCDIIEDTTAETKDRLKAMEMLKRSCGDFLDRVQVNTHHTIELPDVDADTMRAWARLTLPTRIAQEGEEAEVVGPH